MTISSNAKDFLIKIQQNKDLSKLSKGILSSTIQERKNVLDLNIAVGLDVSGSISRSTFVLFMKQLDAIKGLSRVKVVEIDTQIVAVYDYELTKQNRIARLKGGGGTHFSPAFNLFQKLKPDAILFMTDGYVAGSCSDPQIPTGWIMTNNNPPPYGFGEVIVRL